MALYSVAPVFIAVRIGEMASHLGTGPLLVKGGALFLIGLGVQAFAKSIVFVFLGALITGVAFTTLQIVLQLHIGESSVPQLRVRNFGYFSMAQSAANSIAAIMAGFISSQFGLQVPFGVNAGIAIIGAMLIYKYKGPIYFRFTPTTESTNIYRREPLTQLITRRDVLITLIAGALLAMAWDLHSFIVPFVSEAAGLNPQRVGIVFGIFSAATFVVRIALPGISKFASNSSIVKASLASVGFCFLLYPWWMNYVSLSIFAAILGLALGTAQPSLLALIHEIVPEKDLGRIIGFRTVLLNVGATVWPILFGISGASALTMLLVVAGTVIFMFGLCFPTLNGKGPNTY